MIIEALSMVVYDYDLGQSRGDGSPSDVRSRDGSRSDVGRLERAPGFDERRALRARGGCGGRDTRGTRLCLFIRGYRRTAPARALVAFPCRYHFARGDRHTYGGSRTRARSKPVPRGMAPPSSLETVPVFNEL